MGRGPPKAEIKTDRRSPRNEVRRCQCRSAFRDGSLFHRRATLPTPIGLSTVRKVVRLRRETKHLCSMNGRRALAQVQNFNALFLSSATDLEIVLAGCILPKAKQLHKLASDCIKLTVPHATIRSESLQQRWRRIWESFLSRWL